MLVHGHQHFTGPGEVPIRGGDPLRNLHPLFDLPDQHTTSVSGIAAYPAADALVALPTRAERPGLVESLPLFGG